MMETSHYGMKSRWHFLLLSTFGVALLFFRKPIEVLFLPARWEDVTMLLVPAMQQSWKSIFFIHYYYFQLVPTIVTIFSLRLLGVKDAMVGMNVAAIVIAALCASFFATRQFRFIIKNDLSRALCSVFILLVPGITEEIYSTISSIYVFLNIFTMLFVTLLLFRYEEFEKKSSVIKCLYAFFCSVSFLTSAFSVILLPVLAYVMIRQLPRNGSDKITKCSYVIPTVLLVVQAITICISYLQQSKSPLPSAFDVIMLTVNGMTISASKMFYHNTPFLFQNIGGWMYLIPISLVAFILLNSIKRGMKFEIYILLCIVATLFFSSAIKSSVIDWNCLCGQTQERYLFFAIIFFVILAVRQLDRIKSLPFRLAFLAIMTVVAVNIGSGFFIPVHADENWKYVTQSYDPLGKLRCFVGERQGWSVTIPCSQPIPTNITASGSSLILTPPIESTVITVISTSVYTIFGAPETFIASITPIPDGGTVSFEVDGITVGSPIGIFGGQAEYGMSLPVGKHNISATYLGSPNFYASASGPITITVLPTSNLKMANLSGANLEKLNLSYADMEYANLTNADLEGANLTGANLGHAITAGTNLQGTIIRGCIGCT